MCRRYQFFHPIAHWLLSLLPTRRAVTAVSIISLSFLLLSSLSVQANEYETNKVSAALSLERAITLAQRNDPWLKGSFSRQQSLESRSNAAAILPAPKVSLGIANLPIDDFDLNQEPMSQLKLGVAQDFPRGDTLVLRQKRLSLLSTQHPFQRDNQMAKVSVAVAQLWLDAFRAQESIRMIETNRELFDYLVDTTESNFVSAMKGTRQQDLIRAQLEITRLDDRLIVLNERHDLALFKLWQWFQAELPQQSMENPESLVGLDIQLNLVNQLPDIPLKHAELLQTSSPLSAQTLWPYIAEHPAVRSLEQKVTASRLNIDLAKQKYKPQWGVNASYGYRDKDSRGNNGADFFSLGFTFDLPIFTTKRNDSELQSVVSDSEAIKTEKWLLVRKMLTELEAARARLLSLNQRQSLYQSRLVKEAHDYAEASLNAYTSDDADFYEVVRAGIAELNVSIDALDIDVEKMKTIVQLNYFFTKSASKPDNARLEMNHE